MRFKIVGRDARFTGEAYIAIKVWGCSWLASWFKRPRPSFVYVCVRGRRDQTTLSDFGDKFPEEEMDKQKIFQMARVIMRKQSDKTS